MKPTQRLKFLLPELNEAQLQVIERYVEQRELQAYQRAMNKAADFHKEKLDKAATERAEGL